MRTSGSSGRWTAVLAGACAAALAAAAWRSGVGSSSLRSLVESPETGIRRALAEPAQPDGPRPLEGSPATFRLDALSFSDLLVTAAGSGADVVAVARADGVVAWRGLEVKVTYVGRERLRMIRCEGARWCADGERAPRLRALLSALSRRADAFDDADAGRYGPLIADDYRGPEGGKPELLRRLAADLGASPRARLRPLGWQLRIERETAQVGEDFEIAAGAAGPRRLRARFDLRDEGGRWRFTGGL